MTKVISIDIEIPEDSSDAGNLIGRAIEPDIDSELTITITEIGEESDVFPDNPRQLQVHLAGTGYALEELGKYLIALARSPRSDPNPYGSFDHVRNTAGGTIRFIPRVVRP